MNVKVEAKCPRCGKPGTGPYARPVMARGKTYVAWYMAHSGAHVGKTHKVRWCYLKKKMLVELGVPKTVVELKAPRGKKCTTVIK